jgi:hypothetical protein
MVDSEAKLDLKNLTIADGEVHGSEFVFGGGIHNSDTLTVMNSTIRDSEVRYPNCFENERNGGGGGGGGIYNNTNATLTVTNSTFSGNSVGSSFNPGSGGGIYAHHFSTLTLSNTILSDNLCGGNCGFSHLGPT